ncbi:hypothetical protein EV2_033433 [Malus domestica]
MDTLPLLVTSPPIVSNCFLNVPTHPKGKLETAHGIVRQSHGHRLDKDFLLRLGQELLRLTRHTSFDLISDLLNDSFFGVLKICLQP